jgi:Na+/H+-dicarboxylate symporter
MSNLLILGAAVFLLTVVIQIIAVIALVRYLRLHDRLGRIDTRFWYATWTLVGAMLILFVGHLFQVGIWAALFHRLGAFEEFETAFYHSAVNFSSLGYGDIVMPEGLRLLGAMEAAGGVLMFGLSAGVGFALINSMLQATKDKDTD